MKLGQWKGLLSFLSVYVWDIPSTLGSESLSAPITWMPFGKRLLTSAVEGEFKQSASYSRSTLCPQLQPYMMVVEAWSIYYCCA